MVIGGMKSCWRLAPLSDLHDRETAIHMFVPCFVEHWIRRANMTAEIEEWLKVSELTLIVLSRI